MTRLLDAFRLRGESKAEKALVLAVSTFVMLATTGSVYGWSPVLLILQEQGVYSELCTGDDTPQDGNLTVRPFFIFIFFVNLLITKFITGTPEYCVIFLIKLN
jgi:hypothetical protein